MHGSSSGSLRPVLLLVSCERGERVCFTIFTACLREKTTIDTSIIQQDQARNESFK
jgi:hypothetical protein